MRRLRNLFSFGTLRGIRQGPAAALSGGMSAAVLVAAVLVAGGAARAQENLDEGKSALQLFQSDCAVCHAKSQGLARTNSVSQLTDFLRQHYSASKETAQIMANFLSGTAAAPGSGRPTVRTRATEREPPTEHRRPSHVSREDADKPERKDTRETKRDEKKDEAKKDDKKDEARKDEPRNRRRDARHIDRDEKKDEPKRDEADAAKTKEKSTATATTAQDKERAPAPKNPLLTPMTAETKTAPAPAQKPRVDNIAD